MACFPSKTKGYKEARQRLVAQVKTAIGNFAAELVKKSQAQGTLAENLAKQKQ